MELDEIRRAIETDLADLSVQDFDAKYFGTQNRSGSAVELSDTRVCDECHRTIARSEMMRFNMAYTHRAGWDVLCPACGDARTRHRLAGRAPHSYVVRVPNEDFLADCVRSYLAHGWTIATQVSGETQLRNGRRQVVVRLAPSRFQCPDRGSRVRGCDDGRMHCVGEPTRSFWYQALAIATLR